MTLKQLNNLKKSGQIKDFWFSLGESMTVLLEFPEGNIIKTNYLGAL